MEINSMVVIDDNLENRVAFGMAVQEVKGDIDYYPFTFIDEALTIPNALIQSTPDIIFINLDIPYNNGLDCIRMLRAVEQYKNYPSLFTVIPGLTNSRQNTWECLIVFVNQKTSGSWSK
ncbi:hypothetical protein GVN16_03745 [Emticicia sp. CRIBPO]|uniref:hypothetical protein n=1 Tax=Emticicia sp. CRIBPO TaxID=2683258 RepID=UPI0014124F0B|nr:hypothetical protein [Emticicia sp. CRIBPO]NBA84855.1 hypothetical protein [Emticicia sp. CRIBPO]